MSIDPRTVAVAVHGAGWPERMEAVPPPWSGMSLMKRQTPLAVWRSRHFLAVLYGPAHLRLTVNRVNRRGGKWADGITWDELQQVKAECDLSERWCVEVYPPESQAVRAHNMRHLWLLDGPPPYAWRDERGPREET